MKVAIILAGVLSGLIFAEPGIGQDLPTCISTGSDADGDGYGWENGQSCVVQAVQMDQGSCEDRGGYPWGWDPVTATSCRLDTVVDNAPIENHSNTIGDASADCIDTDGDGWGWNGSESCTLEVETVTGAVTELTATGTDIKWKVCDAAAVINDGEIQGTAFLSSGYPVRCIRQCSEGVSTVALPDYPGWGYDNQLGLQCVITDDLVEYNDDYSGYGEPSFNLEAYYKDNERYGVPAYVPDEEPQRLVFENRLLYPLYTGDGIWECNGQSRDGIDQSFVSIGSTQYLKFTNVPVEVANDILENQNELRIWNANTGLAPDDYETGAWLGSWLGSTYATEAPYLRLRGDSAGFGSFNGHMQLDGDDLKIYKNPFSRQSCQRTTSMEQVNLPSSFEQVEALTSLTLNELLNMPLQCTAFETTTYRDEYSPVTYSINETFDAASIDVIVQFVGVDDEGADRYQLTDSVDAIQVPWWADSWSSHYIVSEDTVFSRGYLSAVARTNFGMRVEFKRFGQKVIRVDSVSSGWQKFDVEKTLYQCN